MLKVSAAEEMVTAIRDAELEAASSGRVTADAAAARGAPTRAHDEGCGDNSSDLTAHGGNAQVRDHAGAGRGNHGGPDPARDPNRIRERVSGSRLQATQSVTVRSFANAPRWRQRRSRIGGGNGSRTAGGHALHYRVVQEALRNVTKHAQAQEAEIRLAVSDRGRRLRVGPRRTASGAGTGEHA